MPIHQSAKKRVRQSAQKKVHNRYYKKSTRTMIKKIMEMSDKAEAEKFLPEVVSQIDKLAKRNLWHENKAARKKSQIMKHINSLD